MGYFWRPSRLLLCKDHHYTEPGRPECLTHQDSFLFGPENHFINLLIDETSNQHWPFSKRNDVISDVKVKCLSGCQVEVVVPDSACVLLVTHPRHLCVSRVYVQWWAEGRVHVWLPLVNEVKRDTVVCSIPYNVYVRLISLRTCVLTWVRHYCAFSSVWPSRNGLLAIWLSGLRPFRRASGW